MPSAKPEECATRLYSAGPQPMTDGRGSAPATARWSTRDRRAPRRARRRPDERLDGSREVVESSCRAESPTRTIMTSRHAQPARVLTLPQLPSLERRLHSRCDDRGGCHGAIDRGAAMGRGRANGSPSTPNGGAASMAVMAGPRSQARTKVRPQLPLLPQVMPDARRTSKQSPIAHEDQLRVGPKIEASHSLERASPLYLAWRPNGKRVYPDQTRKLRREVPPRP